jgi:hypothetical protein
MIVLWVERWKTLLMWVRASHLRIGRALTTMTAAIVLNLVKQFVDMMLSRDFAPDATGGSLLVKPLGTVKEKSHLFRGVHPRAWQSRST